VPGTPKFVPQLADFCYTGAYLEHIGLLSTLAVIPSGSPRT
jgi:hypothetical protein